MANDVFWTTQTPTAQSAQYAAAYLAVRVAGAAGDGSQDTFAQVLISDIVAAALALLKALPDEANGDIVPVAGSRDFYWSGGVLRRA